MDLIACPSCGEDERLKGRRRDDDIYIHCRSCGARWRRNTRPRCGHCGSTNLKYSPITMFARGRGTMQTPVGEKDAWTCLDCGEDDATRPDEDG